MDRKPDLAARSQVEELFTKLATLRGKKSSGAEPVGLQFDDAAQGIFDSWRDALEIRLRDGSVYSPAFESHLSKYRKLVPSLALVFKLLEEPKTEGFVNSSHLKQAVQWAEYLEQHARKIYGDLANTEVAAAKALGDKIAEGKVEDGCKVRSLCRRQWSKLEKPEAVDRALASLEDSGWIQIHIPKSVGRPTEVIRINPALESFLQSQKKGK